MFVHVNICVNLTLLHAQCDIVSENEVTVGGVDSVADSVFTHCCLKLTLLHSLVFML